LIDVRTAEEVAAQPTSAQPAPARHIPMATLLAHPELLAPGASYLLLCASGKRSLAAARELRKHGLAVRSLAGGLQGLAPHARTGS
jgi:rhodanese-related sulfurtransferase